MLILTLAVSLSAGGYTTIDASSNLDYVLYDATSGDIYVSSVPLGLVYRSPLTADSDPSNDTIMGIGRISANIFRLYYNSDIGGWASVQISSSGFSENQSYVYYDSYSAKDFLGSPTTSYVYTVCISSSLGSKRLYTNGDWYNVGVIWGDGLSSVVSSITPSLDDADLPSGGNIEDIVNEMLNSTTQTTISANEIQSNLATSYSGYQSGTVSAETLQSDVDSAVSTLNTLSDSSGNTLADLMAVNNGLTYAQTVQDKLNADELNEHLEVSSSVSQSISGYITQANTAFTDYSQGSKTQSETITVLQQQIIQLNQLITSGQATTSADIEAVNAAVNTVNGMIDNVGSYSDLNKDVSESMQSSDQEEIDYLDELTGETTSQIQDMSAEKQFQPQQKSESQSILTAVWGLDIFKRLLPICAVFMVVCVALGVKYRL